MRKNSTVPVAHTAKLANLNLTEEQLKAYEVSMSSIVNTMQEVASLDLQSVPLTARVIEEENIFRDDVVQPSLTQEEALQNAKRIHDGHFMVDHILENKDA